MCEEAIYLENCCAENFNKLINNCSLLMCTMNLQNQFSGIPKIKQDNLVVYPKGLMSIEEEDLQEENCICFFSYFCCLLLLNQ